MIYLNLELGLNKSWFCFFDSTYTRVSNLGQILISKEAIQLIRWATYTRVYTVIISALLLFRRSGFWHAGEILRPIISTFLALSFRRSDPNSKKHVMNNTKYFFILLLVISTKRWR